MAIGTYDELKTAIAAWLERAGDTAVSSQAADFITLTEARLNRTLPIREAKVDSPLTGVVSSRELTLPTGFVEPIYLHLIDGTDRIPLKAENARSMVYLTDSGRPSAWCINGDAIDLDCPCDAAYSFVFRNRQKLALSGAAPTNWLLTNHPDVYLFGALVEASIFFPNPEFASAMNQRFDRAVAEISDIEARSEGIATLSVDIGLLPHPMFWAL